MSSTLSSGKGAPPGPPVVEAQSKCHWAAGFCDGTKDYTPQQLQEHLLEHVTKEKEVHSNVYNGKDETFFYCKVRSVPPLDSSANRWFLQWRGCSSAGSDGSAYCRQKKYDVIVHLKCHSKFEEYQCRHCRKSFLRKSDRDRHENNANLHRTTSTGSTDIQAEEASASPTTSNAPPRFFMALQRLPFSSQQQNNCAPGQPRSMGQLVPPFTDRQAGPMPARPLFSDSAAFAPSSLPSPLAQQHSQMDYHDTVNSYASDGGEFGSRSPKRQRIGSLTPGVAASSPSSPEKSLMPTRTPSMGDASFMQMMASQHNSPFQPATLQQQQQQQQILQQQSIMQQQALLQQHITALQNQHQQQQLLLQQQQQQLQQQQQQQKQQQYPQPYSHQQQHATKQEHLLSPRQFTFSSPTPPLSPRQPSAAQIQPAHPLQIELPKSQGWPSVDSGRFSLPPPSPTGTLAPAHLMPQINSMRGTPDYTQLNHSWSPTTGLSPRQRSSFDPSPPSPQQQPQQPLQPLQRKQSLPPFAPPAVYQMPSNGVSPNGPFWGTTSAGGAAPAAEEPDTTLTLLSNVALMHQPPESRAPGTAQGRVTSPPAWLPPHLAMTYAVHSRENAGAKAPAVPMPAQSTPQVKGAAT